MTRTRNWVGFESFSRSHVVKRLCLLFGFVRDVSKDDSFDHEGLNCDVFTRNAGTVEYFGQMVLQSFEGKGAKWCRMQVKFWRCSYHWCLRHQCEWRKQRSQIYKTRSINNINCDFSILISSTLRGSIIKYKTANVAEIIRRNFCSCTYKKFRLSRKI